MIIQGDARFLPLASNSIQCVVTSPPYWGLRDYKTQPLLWGGEAQCLHRWGIELRSAQRQRNGAEGGIHAGRSIDKLADNVTLHPSQGVWCQFCDAWRGSLGLEPTPDLYVQHLVEIFREVRRVLRDDGTVWLNLGDSYSAARPGNAVGDFSSSTLTNPERQDALHKDRVNKWKIAGLKPKDLVGIPWRVAFALRADGWYLRSDIIWAKGYSFHPTTAGSCMPESITDRPTRGHEYLFLLTKSAKYYYDIEAVKEAGIFPAGTRAAKGSGEREGNRRPNEYAEYSGTRNLRSVWLINPKPYREAHFATFPPALVRPCLLAGSASAQCAACKTPYRHVVVREPLPPDIRQRFEAARQQTVERSGRTDGYTNSKPSFVRRVLSETWEPGCTCAAPSEPQRVLDPFGGSGTVAVVAHQLGRRAVVLDLNAAYCQLAREREEKEG